MNGRRIAAALAAGLWACGPSEPSAPAAEPAALSDEARDVVADAAHPSFIVRFRAPHALAQAQSLEAGGRCDEAAALARQALASDATLAGLCFDRFTAGGQEIVLRACAAVAPGAQAAFTRDWLQQISEMASVEYVDVNAIATIEGCRG